MKKIINYLIMMFIFSFIFVYKVSAECSYQERKDLLTDAKNVDISYEAVEDNEGSYDFKFNIVGLTDKVFIKYYNTNNGIETFVHYSDIENGVYSFIDNNAYKIYTYNFVFYSSNEKCLGYEITTKKIKKPMYNIYSENINCTYESSKDFKYCKRFTETDYKLTLNKFNDELVNYSMNKFSKTNSNDNISIANYKKYLIISIIIILFIVTLIVLIIIQKNRL